jgi:hypothetical protein
VPVRTSAAVVGEVWRGDRRQADLARVLAGVEATALDQAAGRRVGRLLGRSTTADVVEGHLSLLVGEGDTVLTSDPQDMRRLLRARSVSTRLHEV